MKVLSILIFISVLYVCGAGDAASNSGISNEIVIEFSNVTTPEYIKQHIEARYGFVYKRKLFDDFHVFQFQHYFKSKRNAVNVLDLNDDDLVKWHQVQTPLRRRKRDFFGNIKDLYNEFLYSEDIITPVAVQCKKSKYSFNDPFWPFQWYMNDGCLEGVNINITAAWDLGYTGRDVVLSIIDDGVESMNEELRGNYDPNASIDLNDGDDNPQPRYEVKNENKHGTRCAGEISASANNSICGVGIAYNSHIGGIRLLDGRINDRIEAEALTFNIDYIDIFSASWGPLDNGKTVEGPDRLTTSAFLKGVNQGRAGKGVIYVWASGNGGRVADDCNCDGYTASIYTITISSVTKQHVVPAYSERCASILATTYSSDVSSNSIVTSDIRNQCTKSHTGTSASAPIAAGIIALVLEANRNLTWRDVQYLIVLTSDNSKLKSNKWGVNGVGRRFNHEFGFGLMNAGLMVERARTWKNVGEQVVCSISVKIDDYIPIVASQQMLISVRVDQCRVRYLEHVIAKLTIESGNRGALQITLVSPLGTESNLLDYRPLDKSKFGFQKWPFMSVHYWGETPVDGEWVLKIRNSDSKSAFLRNWTLVLHGIGGITQLTVESSLQSFLLVHH